jgi:eukaryotic-like serine/threonine-protein kinase
MSMQCPACLSDNPSGTANCMSCGYILLDATASSSTYHLATGTLLKQGNYRVENILGEGGFGITYKGTYLANSATVAIKELWPEKAVRQASSITWPSSISPVDRQRQIQKFKLEANYLQKCLHPNVVKVYDWFDENNTVYIVMEFIPGKSLHKILQEEGKLPEDRVKRYFIQIVEALKVVHANNFLHRDIKPDNILIDDRDRAVLIDFGATREFIAGQTREMSVTLTKGYAPLEQYSYQSKRWPATDFYALCASMYELLTGELPAEAVLRAQSETLIFPRKLCPNITVLTEKVILTGMKMKVEERFQTADELINALNGRYVSPSRKRSQELVKQGKLAEAVVSYKTCLLNDPNDGETTVEMALVQTYLNDSQAKIAAQKAIQLKPNDGRGYGVLGLLNCRQSNWSEAVRQLQKAASLAPQELWIQANLAWALGKSENWQEAENAVAKALHIDSNCAFALGLQAWIAVNKQQWKPAIRAARQAITKSKQTNHNSSQELQRWVYPCLTIALDRAIVTHQATDLERCLQEFTTQVPDSAFFWGFKGWKQARQGLWTEALSSFKQASYQARVPAWVFVNQGIAQEHLNDIQGAIQTYEAYEKNFPPNAFALFRLGTLLGRVGKWARLSSDNGVECN